jgi:uncharacterized phage-associated protein
MKAGSSHAPYDARAVANLLLDLADARNVRLTQVFLLKLLYFAHGWYLARNGTPLIAQEFEAWERGPVVKVVRDEFKSCGKRPITVRACKLDIYSGRRTKVMPDLSPRDADFVASIFEAYRAYDAWQLSDMTHETDSPWDRVWNSSEPIGRLALRLRNEDIKAHFEGLSKRFRLL